MTTDSQPWLFLLHQLPPKPAYFRVRVWRRLQQLGAVAIKNSVYALPAGDETREDFEWLLREIVAGGGEACILEGKMIEGMSDQDIRRQFDAARDADYRAVAEEARGIAKAARGKRRPDDAADSAAGLKRLRKRLAEIAAIDFFGANGRETAEALVSELETRARAIPAAKSPAKAAKAKPLAAPKGRTWVTRQGIQIDRMACAWLVRRFIDADATFKFVSAQSYRPARDEVRFDMFEAEFTHEGDRCSFEVLLQRGGLDDPALRQIGEIVHDIDIKDGKFDRPEAAGIAQLIAGIAMTEDADEARLTRSAVVFDDLFAFFKRQRRTAKATRKDRRR